jgi:hypothetical protein
MAQGVRGATAESPERGRLMPGTDPTNKRDAAGDPICPLCETAITITDGSMRIRGRDEIAHIRCEVDRRRREKEPE